MKALKIEGAEGSRIVEPGRALGIAQLTGKLIEGEQELDLFPLSGLVEEMGVTSIPGLLDNVRTLSSIGQFSGWGAYAIVFREMIPSQTDVEYFRPEFPIFDLGKVGE